MTGQDFQDRLDAIVRDLQTVGKGQEVAILFRGSDNQPSVLTLSSDSSGVVDATALTGIQNYINPLKTIADTYETERVPVMEALEEFNAARAVHQTLIDAASAARTALNDALEADADYQAAKDILTSARTDVDYIAAKTAYEFNNTSENFAELSQAKGSYIV